METTAACTMRLNACLLYFDGNLTHAASLTLEAALHWQLVTSQLLHILKTAKHLWIFPREYRFLLSGAIVPFLTMKSTLNYNSTLKAILGI